MRATPIGLPTPGERDGGSRYAGSVPDGAKSDIFKFNALLACTRRPWSKQASSNAAAWTRSGRARASRRGRACPWRPVLPLLRHLLLFPLFADSRDSHRRTSREEPKSFRSSAEAGPKQASCCHLARRPSHPWRCPRPQLPRLFSVDPLTRESGRDGREHSERRSARLAPRRTRSRAARSLPLSVIPR